MATSNHTFRIDTPTRRKNLPPRREPYWCKVKAGQYLGFRRQEEGGAWVARLRTDEGKQRYQALGDGLSFDDAQDLARDWFDRASTVEDHRYRVSDAVQDYIEHLTVNNSEAAALDTQRRLNKHLTFGDVELTQLRTARIKRWHQGMVRLSDDEEDVRRSKDGANRVLTMLKAALNTAFHGGLVASDSAWRRVKPFHDVGANRRLFLTDDQVKRLLGKTAGGLHNLIRAGVLTGARFGELQAARVRDLDPKRGILSLSGKTGSRDCYLSDEAVRFLGGIARDRLPDAWLFVKDDGDPWGKGHQVRPMKEAVRRARLPREAVFYSLRHYHISKALLAGIPAQVVAENTGTSIRMLERHYGKFMATDRRRLLNQVELGL